MPGDGGARVWGSGRQGVDLEHWAAFRESFGRVASAVTEVADGRRGRPPATVTFLSGDVHHPYLAEVRRDRDGSKVLQAVCSPIRNPLPRVIRTAQGLASTGERPPVEWRRFAAYSAVEQQSCATRRSKALRGHAASSRMVIAAWASVGAKVCSMRSRARASCAVVTPAPCKVAGTPRRCAMV